MASVERPRGFGSDPPTRSGQARGSLQEEREGEREGERERKEERGKKKKMEKAVLKTFSLNHIAPSEYVP